MGRLLTDALRQLVAAPPRSPRPDPIRLRVLHRGGRLRIETVHPGPRFALPEPRTELVAPRRQLPADGAAIELGVTTLSGVTSAWVETSCVDPGCGARR